MVGSRFERLIDLAQDESAERRRELLREVADLFFQTGGRRSRAADGLFDEVLQSVAETIHEEALVELAQRFADAPDPPSGLSRDLANRAIEVAEPVLRRSAALTDEELVQVVRHRSQAHVEAVAQRPQVSERLAEAIVRTGDDSALAALVRNHGARISRSGFARLADRGRRSAELRRALVDRRDTPIGVLNEMFFHVEPDLRRSILARNIEAQPGDLDKDMTAMRERRRRAHAEMDDETRRASVFARLKRADGELTAKLLIALLRDRQHARFQCGLAELTGVAVETARAVVARKDVDALATIWRASDLECASFATLAATLTDSDEGSRRAFVESYEAIPPEGAKRVMRFHMVRGAGEDRAAA
jgi:uncharacterized protein (DUF2336 family)